MQKICVVIPCYNESKRLDFAAFEIFIQIQNHIDFLFANDGSTDNTLELLQKFNSKHPERVFVFDLKNNSGKAEAVRCGILKAVENKKYEFVGFWDADLATPLSEINNLLHQIKNLSKKMAMASRMKRLGSTVDRKLLRHLLGRVFSTFSSWILKLPVYDSQCGAKLFSADVAYLFEEKFITSWLFDIELIARYRNRHGIKGALSDIVEVPVNEWIEKGDSRLKFKDMLRVPIELFRINNKYN